MPPKPPRPLIDLEICDLLPPHTPEEYRTLEIKIQVEGCADALVVWKEEGILLDGHNRLAICEIHDLPYQVRYMNFQDRELAIQWVIDNQLGRRNLTDERRAYYIGKEYLRKKKSHGAAARIDGDPSGQNDHLGESTAANLAAKHGVGEKTIRRNAKFAEQVDAMKPEEAAKVLAGKSDVAKGEIAKGLCPRCARVGAVKDCPKCAELRKPSKKSPPPKAAKDDVPKSVRNALADTWHAECARLLSKMAKEAKSAFGWSSWLDAAVLDHLKAAEECFLTAVPKKLCPDCKGQKTVDKKSCQTCRQGGYLASQVA